MAHDVFISYSTRNKPVADAICAGLEAEKLRCWIAPRDVLPGQNYGESIVHAIAGCQVMVLVFSEATNVSQAVIREAERAMHHNKPIIPFRIEDTPMSAGLEFFLASCHWLDAIQPPMDAHIAHLARSVKGLIGEAEYVPEKQAPSAPPKAAPNKLPWIVAGAAVLAVAGGALAWKQATKPLSNKQVAAAPNTATSLTLATSLAGAGNGAIASHFGASPRFQSADTEGVLTISSVNTPVPGKVTVVTPADGERWLDLPTVELDLKLLNNGGTTAYFQRAVLDVTSSTPENKPVWLVDGTRLPKVLALRSLAGGDDPAPKVSFGIAGPEDGIELDKLPPAAPAATMKDGVAEFPLPRGPRPGIEETLFGRVDDTPFEIPFVRTPPSKAAAPPKDPEPLYTIKLRETGEHYQVSCDLSQYVQAGEGDRFFLRLESPALARHRFKLTLEYDDGSGGIRSLQGPAVDATLFPVP